MPSVDNVAPVPRASSIATTPRASAGCDSANAAVAVKRWKSSGVSGSARGRGHVTAAHHDPCAVGVSRHESS